MGILEELRPLTYLFIFTTELLRSDVNPVGASHAVILESVRSGDAAAAEGAVRDHILESGELLLRRLDAEDKGTL